MRFRKPFLFILTQTERWNQEILRMCRKNGEFRRLKFKRNNNKLLPLPSQFKLYRNQSSLNWTTCSMASFHMIWIQSTQSLHCVYRGIVRPTHTRKAGPFAKIINSVQAVSYFRKEHHLDLWVGLATPQIQKFLRI